MIRSVDLYDDGSFRPTRLAIIGTAPPEAIENALDSYRRAEPVKITLFVKKGQKERFRSRVNRLYEFSGAISPLNIGFVRHFAVCMSDEVIIVTGAHYFHENVVSFPTLSLAGRFLS